MNITGITVTAANITITGFSSATAGYAGTPNGTNGTFNFTVALSKGSSSLTTSSKNGTIKATGYVAPSNYAITILGVFNGTVTASQDIATEGTPITLNITPSDGYELASISAYKTGEQSSTVTLSGSGNSRSFNMPAYYVTVTATFQKTANQVAIETALSLIEAASYVVPQATANTETTVKTWLVTQINALPGMAATGISVVAGNIAITGFNAAIEGTSGISSGSNGSFTFSVTLSKGSSSLTSAGKNGIITATGYTYQNHTVTIASMTNGTVTANSTSPKEMESVTLTINPAAGYELNTISAYRTGDQSATVTLSGSGNSRTFTMPAFNVTVSATFMKTNDQNAVETAKSLIENENYTVAQATANTEANVKLWIVSKINSTPGMAALGIAVTVPNITITYFKAAIEGTSGTPAGTNGAFTFTVSVTKGNSNLTVTNISGTITATEYAAQNYTVTVSTTTNGTVTANSTNPKEKETVTLSITPAAGYELNSISAYKTGDQSTTVTLSGSGNSRNFTMPAYNVTVTTTFKKTQQQLDKEAVDAVKAAIEGGTFRIAQATGNDETTVKTWLLNTINVLLGQMNLNANLNVGNMSITSITPAITGTEATPDGINGSFKFKVTLTKGATTLTTGEIPGIIVATPYDAKPVKRIELALLNELTVQILNTGNLATGELTLKLSGVNADVFTLPSTTANSLIIGGETYIFISSRANLAQGVYRATLTVSGEGITPISVEIIYVVFNTGIDDIQTQTLKAWTQNGNLYVTGLTVGKIWSVYNLSGALVYRSISTGEEANTPLRLKGIFIVQSENKAVKVVNQ